MLELAWQLYITGKHKMGRYISTGSAQTGTNACSTIINSTCYQTATQKYAYDGNSCWQNRVILDTPGSYTFTVPAGATCIRTIAVGGGGKPKCTVGSCCGMAGAGGAYVERIDTVASGCTVTVVVGRQEQDTTISYTNSSAVARTLTAGGAAGCVAGVGSGGDWNSNGGCAGCNYNLCSSYSHYCGSCICCSPTTCCGYCIVWAGIAIGINPGHQGDDCCNARFAGGGSAGSWIWPTGGAGQSARNTVAQGFGMSGGGASAGGGGGIGYICRQPMGASNCSCVCASTAHFTGYGPTDSLMANYPTASGGGGGTKFQTEHCCDCTQGAMWSCCHGLWREGAGGWGGYDNNEGNPGCFMWGRSGTACSCMFGLYSEGCWWPSGPDPVRHAWHDIHNMCGSGSTGKNIFFDGGRHWCGPIQWASRIDYSTKPANSGEGAGTGGVVFGYCESSYFSGGRADQFPAGVNWPLLCCLGTANKICCSDRMEQSLFPNVITCAGTLGGSGGVGINYMASKAGKGGGAGVYRCYVMCVCWCGSYNLCNGSGAALAYPPCDLDWRLSTAGTGMAIIYWKS